jgi:hypothetical protein
LELQVLKLEALLVEKRKPAADEKVEVTPGKYT